MVQNEEGKEMSNQSIRFQGKQFILVPRPDVGDASKNGDIYTKHQYEQQLMSSAILRDGVIWRNHKVIGFQRQIKMLGEDNTQIVVGPWTRMLRAAEAMERMNDPICQFLRERLIKATAVDNQAKIDAEAARQQCQPEP